VLDQYKRLAFWVDAGPMEGMARYDADIGGEVLLEGFDLWGFARSLAADDGADLGGYS
jgi:hypothetical protein